MQKRKNNQDNKQKLNATVIVVTVIKFIQEIVVTIIENR